MPMQHNVITMEAQTTPIDDLSNIFAPIDVLHHSVGCAPSLRPIRAGTYDSTCKTLRQHQTEHRLADVQSTLPCL